MKALKIITIIVSTFALLLLGVLVYVIIINPGMLKKGTQQESPQPEISISNKEDSKLTLEDEGNINIPPNSNSVDADSAALIIGKWNGKIVTDKNVGESLEFFQDGTFRISSIFLDTDPQDHVTFTGLYSFSDPTRLKLQFEEGIIVNGPNTFTNPDNEMKILDIIIDENLLTILNDDFGYINKEWVKE